MKKLIVLSGLLVIVGSFVVSAPAHADKGDFAKKHPRRAEVLRRDKRLEKRTENAEKNGKITDAQAQKLEKEESAIRAQEQADAKAHGGHITKAEQRRLNREENHVNRELRRDERKDAANGGASAGAGPAAPAAPSAGQPVPGSAPATVQH